MKMTIQDQFNLISDKYDKNRRKFIPCFDDFYESTTAFISAGINTPKSIVDLGAGTGSLSYHWYKYFPNAKYMLIDIADDMLDVAKRRFQGIDTFSYEVSDYKSTLPDISFDTVISALSIHHLEDNEKENLFSKIYEALPQGGVFVNYDQFCAGENELNKWYDSYWEQQLYNSGLTKTDIELWHERRKLDRECSVEQEMDMLKRSGFETVKCVYSYQKFSVILAKK